MPPATDSSPPGAGAPRVMISSTVLDLPEHRKAVEDAILRLGCLPLAMEHATAKSDSDAIRFSRQMVDQADIYVGVLGHRYGDVPEDPALNPQRWSVTEIEYRRAVERSIPVLCFVMDEDHAVTRRDVEQDQVKIGRLAALKDQVQRGICAFFSSPVQLDLLAYQALNEQMREPGRVSAIGQRSETTAGIPRPPELYAVPPYTLASDFVGRAAELDELDAWAAAADPVMVVEAIGGMGKSALAWEWVQRRAALSVPDLAGRVWWSFYERGTSMGTFLRHALAYITEEAPEGLRRLDAQAIGLSLLGELRKRPFLLVLDGFERVLTAYHRSNGAQLRDDRVAVEARECTHPRDGDLLRQLVHCAPSKLLVSARLMPRALQDRHTHQAIPGVRHRHLEGLAPTDALAMVRGAGIRGDRGAILRFAAQFERHALILRIVCGMVADYRLRPNDFEAWLADPTAGGGVRLSQLPLVQRRTHILEHALAGLEDRIKQLLSRIAVLSDGASYATIAVLNPFLPAPPEEVRQPEDPAGTWEWRSLQRRLETAPTSAAREAAEAQMGKAREGFRLSSETYELYREALRAYQESEAYRQGLAAFHAALRDLEGRGLLQWDRVANTYDLHPVVRAHAFEQLEEGERRRAYSAIRDHFAALPPEEVEEATELTQVKNSLEIVRALIGAGRIEEAVAVCSGDLGRSLLYSIGANHTVLELWEPLVRDRHHGLLAAVDAQDRSYVLNFVAIALECLGRLDDARTLLVENTGSDLEAGDVQALTVGLGTLGLFTKNLNMLALADGILNLMRELAEVSHNEEELTWALLEAAAFATRRGHFEAAASLLAEFQQCTPPPLRLYRPGDLEYQMLLTDFYQGRLRLADLDRAEKVAAGGRSIWRQADLAALRAEWELVRGNASAALDAVDRALAIDRRLGFPAAGDLALRALALARLGRGDEAREALEEGEETQQRGHSSFQRDAAAAWLALGDLDQARRHVRLAYRIAWADGPPHTWWYDLRYCRELMARLGEPEPRLAPFDPAKIEPVPHEEKIRALIERLRAEDREG